MSLEIAQLPDKFQCLDWGKCIYVNCGQSFTFDKSNTQCCLCGEILKTYNTKNHALIGSSNKNVDEIRCKVYYLCRNCKRQCTICKS